MKIYCLNCGSLITYSLNKPEKCNSCGKSPYTSLPTVAAKPPKRRLRASDVRDKKPKGRVRLPQDEEVGSPTTSFDLSKVRRLEVDFEDDGQQQYNKIKIEDLLKAEVASNPGGQAPVRKRGQEIIQRRTYTEDVMQDFLKEAGTLRPK